MDIFLQKKVINDSHLSAEGLAVYIVLRSLMNDTDKKYYVSNHMLAYLLTGKLLYDKSLYQKIKAGMDNLSGSDLNLLSKVSSIADTDYIMDLSKLHFIAGSKDEKNNIDYFTKITLDEVHAIMGYEKEKRKKGQRERDKFKVLKYFVVLIGSLSNKTFLFEDNCYKNTIQSFIGGLTIDYLSTLSGIPRKTLIDYNTYLEEQLKLIYVYRHNDFILQDGEIKSLNNGYGRYSDKEFIIKWCEQHADLKGSENCNKKSSKRKAHKKNSFLQKYNAIANGKNYDKEEDVIAIYQFICKYNKDQDNLIKGFENNTSNTDEYNKMQIDKLSAKKKDISVFDRFDYLNDKVNDLSADGSTNNNPSLVASASINGDSVSTVPVSTIENNIFSVVTHNDDSRFVTNKNVPSDGIENIDINNIFETEAVSDNDAFSDDYIQHADEFDNKSSCDNYMIKAMRRNHANDTVDSSAGSDEDKLPFDWDESCENNGSCKKEPSLYSVVNKVKKVQYKPQSKEPEGKKKDITSAEYMKNLNNKIDNDRLHNDFAC